MPTTRSPWGARQARWWATDALRVVAAVSVPAAGWVAGPASAACLFLVLGGAMLIRFLLLPPVTDAACQLVFLAAAWAAVTGLYQQVAWLDVPAHAIGTAACVVLAWRLTVLADPSHRDLGRASLLWHLLGAAAVLSLLWEVGEWAGYTYVSSAIGVGYDDTIGDLVVGTAGGALLALPLAVADARRRHPDPTARR